MTQETKVRRIGAVIGLVGIVLVFIYGGWLLGLGILLAMYGDNLSNYKAPKEPYEDMPSGNGKSPTFQRRTIKERPDS